MNVWQNRQFENTELLERPEDVAEAEEAAPAGLPNLSRQTPVDDKPARPAVVRELFSRDLVDTYFRQMGNAELLSREGEIALAKRIEAAQQAMLEGLGRVPMLIDRIDRWVEAWRAGTLRLDQLVDSSMADPGPPADADDDAEADEAADAPSAQAVA